MNFEEKTENETYFSRKVYVDGIRQPHAVNDANGGRWTVMSSGGHPAFAGAAVTLRSWDGDEDQVVPAAQVEGC